MQIFVIDWQDVLVDSSDLPTYLAATYLPLSGAVPMSGALDMGTNDISSAGSVAFYDSVNDTQVPLYVSEAILYLDGVAMATTGDVNDALAYVATLYATQAYASNASNLASGTVADNRLSANVPLKNAANTFTAAQTVSAKIRGNAAIVNNNGTQGANGPSLEMAFTNYGIGANSNGEPVSIINATVRNRLGVDIIVGSNGSFGIGNAAHAGLDSTADVKWVRNATGPTLDVCAAGGLRVRNADGSGPAPAVFDAWHGTSGGRHMVLGGAFVQLDKHLYMNSTTIFLNAAGTTSISFASAGVAQIGTTSNNALGSLNLANLTASGDIVLTGASRTIVIGNSQPFNWIANYNNAASVDVSGNSLVTIRTANSERIRFEAAGITAAVGFNFAPRTKTALLATSATATAGVWRITDSTPAQRLAYPDGTNWRYMSDDTVVT